MNNRDFKQKHKKILKDFFAIYTKYSGLVPLSKIKEFINEQTLDEKEKLIEILYTDGMIRYSKEDVLDLDVIDNEEDIEIIDDIEVELTNETSEAKEYKIALKKKTIDDEIDLFNYFSEQVGKNELEYVSIPELINVFINAIPYTKTNESQRFIELFIEVLEENF